VLTPALKGKLKLNIARSSPTKRQYFQRPKGLPSQHGRPDYGITTQRMQIVSHFYCSARSGEKFKSAGKCRGNGGLTQLTAWNNSYPACRKWSQPTDY